MIVVAAAGAFTVGLQHAYHRHGVAAEGEGLADGVGGSVHFAGGLRADDRHKAAVVDVGLGQEAPFGHRPVADVLVAGSRALHRPVVIGVHAGLDRSGNVGQRRDVGDGFAFRQLVQAVGCDGVRPPGVDGGGDQVGAHALDTGGDGAVGPLTDGDQHHDGQYADHHAQNGQKRAHFIAGNGLQGHLKRLKDHPRPPPSVRRAARPQCGSSVGRRGPPWGRA